MLLLGKIPLSLSGHLLKDMTLAWLFPAKVLTHSQVFPEYTSAFPPMYISNVPMVGPTNDDEALEIASVHVYVRAHLQIGLSSCEGFICK